MVGYQKHFYLPCRHLVHHSPHMAIQIVPSCMPKLLHDDQVIEEILKTCKVDESQHLEQPPPTFGGKHATFPPLSSNPVQELTLVMDASR